MCGTIFGVLLEHKIRVTMTSPPQVRWRARPFQFWCEMGLGPINMSKPGNISLSVPGCHVTVHKLPMSLCLAAFTLPPRAWLHVLRIKPFLFSSTSLSVLPSPLSRPPNYFPVSKIKKPPKVFMHSKAHGLKLYVPCNALAKEFACVFGEHLIFMNIHPRKEPSHS